MQINFRNDSPFPARHYNVIMQIGLFFDRNIFQYKGRGTRAKKQKKSI